MLCCNVLYRLLRAQLNVITLPSCSWDWVCVNFFSMFGQGKIIEVFRYHNLKLNSLMFSLCLLYYRQENMRPSIPAWTMTLAEGAWLDIMGELCWLVWRGGCTARSDAIHTYVGIFSSAFSRGYQWGGKNERASAEIILKKSFALSGKLLPREGLVGLHFCWIYTV